MANAVFGFGNLVDAGTLQAGSWETTLPLTNLQNTQYGKVARSTDLAFGSTIIEFDTGSLEQIRVLGLNNHNGSLDAAYRVTIADNSLYTSPTYQGVVTDFWPGVYATEDLDFEAENWWSGQYLLREIAATNPFLPIVLSSSVWGQFVRIEIFDTGNAAGYFQAGRLFVGNGWQPRVNILGGSGIGISTDTTFEKAFDGGLFFDPKTSKRNVAVSLDNMTDDEAMANAFELQRQMGLHGEVVFIWNPDDTVHAIRRRFIGHFTALDTIKYPWVDRATAAFSIEELI